MKRNTAPRFLVVEDEQEIRDMIGFVLESSFSASVQYASTGNEAIELLEKAPDSVDLIVCDYNMPNGNGGHVNTFLFQQKSKIPFILCTADDPEKHPELNIRPIAGYVQKPFFEKTLIQAVEKILTTLNLPSPEEITISKKDFVRAHIRLFKLANVMPCEVFVRLSEAKLVKIYKETDVFSDLEFQKWHDKNIDYLFIHNTNVDLFFGKLVHAYQSLSSARSAEALTQDELTLTLDISASVHDIGSKLGFTKELEKMAKFNVSRAINLINNNPALSELLKRAWSEKSYLSSHSLALSFVSCWLCSKMEWHSEQTMMKLVLASFLHDITISDEEVAKVQNESEFSNEHVRFLEDSEKQWREHPLKAASIAAQFTEVPPDVNVIIAQHHERPHGEGIPYHLSHSRIAPLSALFIIAHDLALFLRNPNSNLSTFVKERKSLYDVGQFKRVLEKLESDSDLGD